MIIERNKYLNQLLRSRHNGMVKVVTGIRRSGKSFLLFNIFKKQLRSDGVDDEHIIEMQFDDFANRKYRNPEVFYDFVKSRLTDGRMYYILLDEIQLLGEFVDVINGLLHLPNTDIYVTGSNARFGSMGGRHLGSTDEFKSTVINQSGISKRTADVNTNSYFHVGISPSISGF